jgi:hypothetical protein
MATPTRAGMSRAGVLLPVTASRATATIGMASLRKVFQMPVSTVIRVIAARLKPQERSIP